MDKNKSNNPWKGLNFYTEGEILYGRNLEIQSLSQYIFNNTQTVLYGRSGIGKSSILYAGIFPKARLKGMIPVAIRLKHDDVDNYILQIRAAIKKSGMKMKSILPSVNGHKKETLWEFMHRHRFYNNDGEPCTPLLVFDQFEEIFTLQKRENIKRDFFRQLGNLLNDVKPDYIVEYERLNRQSLFEEQEMKVISSGTFKGMSLKLNVRRAEVNEQNIPRYLDYPKYHIVFVIREDFLSSLELYASTIPVMKDNRFGLLPINEEQAADIIRLPRKGLVDDEVVKLIIEQVTKCSDFVESNGEVDSAVLSLYLSRLYDQKADAEQQITSDLVNQYGGHIIQDFYFDSIKSDKENNELLSENTVVILENTLLTHEGRRNNVSRNDLIVQGVPSEELDILIYKRKLLRQFKHGNDIRIEYIHDILCSVVKGLREKRELLKKQELERNRQEEEKQKLLQEKERERTVRNIEYNHKKRAAERNVLTHKGRRLIDNSLDFGEFRTLSVVPFHTGVDRFLNFSRLMSRSYEEYFKEETDSEFVNQQVFSDPLLNDSICALSFYKEDERTPTIDGVYGVVLKYSGTLISDIFFKGKRVLSDGRISFGEPIFILGGYCGIHIDYDDEKREIQRIYLDECGNPVITLDGYSVVQTEYDEEDNPVRIRYYINSNGVLIPACHIHGNHGFDSVFDQNGNEVERHFINEFGEPAMIISGVYGKRMSYDAEKFCLLTITNLDTNGELMEDKDGYITESIVYDINGLPTTTISLDRSGKPWRQPSGVYGNVDNIDFSQKIIETYFIDDNGSYVENKDGVFKFVVKINEKRQITESFQKDKNDNLIESEDAGAIQLWNFDEQNRLQSIKFLNKNRQFVSGKEFEYNKEGTHIIRECWLSENGIDTNDSGFAGIEYSVDKNDDLPVLQIFINENKQYITCKDGYNAIRIWEDDQERVIKQHYYDIDGTPMPDDTGVYGVDVEYVDEHTTKRINIDMNDRIIEDHNGVAFTIETVNPSGVYVVQYNIKGEPYADNGFVYISQERESTDYGYNQRLSFQNSDKVSVEFPWSFRADPSWGQVVCMCVETAFDHKDRPLSEYFKDAEGNLVGDDVGDSYTIWEYDDNINQELCSLYNIDGQLKLRIKTIKDHKNRIVERSVVNNDNEYIEHERGYSGELYEYDDEQNTKTITYVDSHGNICTNKQGYARRVSWCDQFGRIVAQKDLSIDDISQGNKGVCNYIEYGKKYGSYYLYRKDSHGMVIPNENGSVYNYIEEDNIGRIIKNLYLDSAKLPFPDMDGDYGLSMDYDDEKLLRIIKCLDENDQVHNNRSGYGMIHFYKDQYGRDIKQLYYTFEGEPVTIPELLGCYGRVYEYPDENSKVTGYLDKEGNITTNNQGYAYCEERVNPENGFKEVYFYDIYKNNTQSLENDNKDYAYAVFEDNDSRCTISLGKDGRKTNNACGYAVRHDFFEDGKLRFYKFYDSDDRPVADNVGNFGVEILRAEDGSMIRLISLNESYDRHVNDYGYCYCDVITDIAGDDFRIWRDMDGNQVLPKLRFAKKIKRWFADFKRKRNRETIFNCRQIGAICDCVLGNIIGDGLAKKKGLRNTYVLLQYDNWNFGDDAEKLSQLMNNSEKQSKYLVLLPITLNGSLITDIGDVVEINFPAGRMGMMWSGWKINLDTLRIINEKKTAWDETSRQ